MSYGHSNWTTDVDNGLHYTDNINNVEYGQKSHSTSPNHKWVGNLFYNYSNKKNRVLFQYRYLQRNWFKEYDFN